MRRGDKIRVRTSICHPSHDGVYAFQEIYWILMCSQNKFEKLNHINIMPSLFFISSNSLRYFQVSLMWRSSSVGRATGS